MLFDWYRTIRITMEEREFHQLPRNPAYQYEYFDGQAHLSPRPKTLTALLPLSPRKAPPAIPAVPLITFRLMVESDWPAFVNLFRAAFAGVQPFASLSESDAREAVTECLDRTRAGNDGPVVYPACFTVESDGYVIGGILITLIPKREPGDWWDSNWTESPLDVADREMGRPHLTWIFVAPQLAGYGIGTALLAHSINALLGLGFADLGSTLSLGNDSSTLWHWRNGFQLNPYPMSKRRSGNREQGS